MTSSRTARTALCAALLATVLTAPDIASARIAVPTSDYNNVDNLKAESTTRSASEEPKEAPGAGAEAEAGDVQGGEDPLGALLPWTLGAVRVMRKVYLECRDEDLSSCLKVQLVRAMDRAARSTRRIALMTGVTLERDPEAQLDDKVLSKDDLESTLPRSLPERERSLDKLILDRIFRFFQNYSLRLKLPSISELNSSVEDARNEPPDEKGEMRSSAQRGDLNPVRIEANFNFWFARRRRPPFNGLLATGLLLGGSLLPMKFAMLAMLAGKALMLSKLALLISALMAMRNMGGGGGGGGHGHSSSHH